jgi:hypothetical protein
MECYDSRTGLRVDGRKQPIGYLLERTHGKNLFVPGHYETPCGGCDTLPDFDTTFLAVQRHHKLGADVLFEGLLASSEFLRTSAMWSRHWGAELFVVGLDVPVEECLAGVNSRRRAKNPDKPDVNPRNTISKYKNVKSVMGKLCNLGVRTASLGREEAFNEIKEELGLCK